MYRLIVATLSACFATCSLAAAAAAPPAAPQSYLQRLPEDEVIYFLLPDRFENGDPANDRGGLAGDRLATGYDSTDKGFFHGGDLKGLIRRLDYIQSLGATAIWLGPVFKNEVVHRLDPGSAPAVAATGYSAGYHGYWITDFTRVDPHFGTEADMHALVDAAHARGMKVYLDIIVNHTADVIQYRECPHGGCPFRSRADYPFQTRGDAHGDRINAGFLGVGPGHQTAANFAKLTRPDYAYTPYIPAGKEHLKVPDWLNDPIYYHNRGNTTFSGPSAEPGDFAGLDDLMTENPRVVRGFVDIFGGWIDRFHVDGFRVDTAKYVNREFWRTFVPAMLARAAADGIPHFAIFGEVTPGKPGDVAELASYTRSGGMPAVLDFAVDEAIHQVIAGNAGTGVLADVFARDDLYGGGEAGARQLPTFLGNHDQGRFAWFIRDARPEAGPDELLRRVELGYAMLLTLRGVPTIYAGDEQGFVGRGGDQAARQDMFPSRVASYNDQPLLGTSATTADSNFDTHHPLYRLIAGLARLRQEYPAFRRGRQVVRDYSDQPGLFAVSRFDPDTGQEFVAAFNTADHALDAQVEVEAVSMQFTSLWGHCDPAPTAPGSLHVALPPLGFVVCAAGAAR